MVNTVEFELLDCKRLRRGASDKRLIDALERVPGIQEIRATGSHRCIYISFNDALIDETTLGETLAELGYPVRPLE